MRELILFSSESPLLLQKKRKEKNIFLNAAACLRASSENMKLKEFINAVCVCGGGG